MPLVTGAFLGPYQILAPLGVGGMGEVYRARDTKLGRDIAIKVLPEMFASDSERRQRFEREARTVAGLNHPNIVTLYSVESDGDALFLTMELVEGKPLSELIPKDGMAVEQILKYMVPLADAVSAAHQRGITHRDLKPANVMVTDDGRVKVLDFGLAKLRDEDAADMTVLPTQSLTGEGRIVGTVAYMSPEQAEGKQVDHRTDIFSLGIILYEVATGRPPFTGDSSASIIASILRDSPSPITDLKPGLPRDLARVVKRSLVKDPEHRYQTAKDFRNELESLKEDVDSGVIATPAPSRAAAPRARRGWLIVAGVLGVGVIAAGVFAVLTNQQRSARPLTFDTVKLSRLTNTGKATLAAISPDGKYVVHAVDEAGQQSLWMRQVATTSDVQIVPPADVRYDGVAFAPDGNYVYYSVYPGLASGNVASLFQVPVLGGTPRRVLEDVDSPVTFSPDGKRLAYLKGFQTDGESAVMVANADGSNTKRLAVRKSPENFPLSNAAWAPDGHAIAVPVNLVADGQRSMAVVAVDVDTGQETRVGSRRWDTVGSVAWLGSGRGLVMTAVEPGGSPQIWHLSYPDGDARRITNDLNNYNQISVTADANALVTVQTNRESHLWVVPAADPRAATEITSGIGRFDGSPAWTSDGRIVYTSNASGNPDIWISDAAGRSPKQLTFDPGSDEGPAVSPDGRTIVFQSTRGGLQVWKMDIDGGNQMPLAKAPGSLRPLMSRDGAWVYYTSVTPERAVWRVPITGGEAIRVTAPASPSDDPARVTLRATFLGTAIAPDGKLLAGSFLDRDARGFRLGLLSTENGELVKTFDRFPISVSFTPDGRTLTYADVKNGVWNAWNQPIDGAPPQPVTSFTSGSIFGVAWSRDGRELVVARGTTTNDVVLVSNLLAPPR